MNVIVTGGLGFIGSHYARLLVENGYDVTIIDKRTYASDIGRIKDIEPRVKVYNIDICDKYLIEPIIRNVDTIVNFASETHVDNSIKNSKPFIHSNYVGVWTLLEVVRKFNNIRFIQIGTDEEYGSIDRGSFNELDILSPGNPYSAAKAGADLLVLSYYNTYGLNVSITRSCNNYGPYQHKEKFIPRMIKLGIEGKSLEVYGNGTNIRDWLYVGDNCLGIKAVMEKGRVGEIYNIGAGNEMTNNEIANIISERFNVPIRYVKDRIGHDFRYSIDSSKIRNELGWEPKISFEVGLEETIRHYLSMKISKSHNL